MPRRPPSCRRSVNGWIMPSSAMLSPFRDLKEAVVEHLHRRHRLGRLAGVDRLAAGAGDRIERGLPQRRPTRCRRVDHAAHLSSIFHCTALGRQTVANIPTILYGIALGIGPGWPAPGGRRLKPASFCSATPTIRPAGSFTRPELEALAELCLNANLTICSDEIHCDLVLEPGCRHLPMASLSPEVARRTITLMAPSKTFNLPGLGCAYAVISDPKLRRRFLRAMAGIVPHVNIFGYAAAQAAYAHGAPWLDALLEYLRDNRQLVYQAVRQMEGLRMAPVEATYLAWIDARQGGLEDPARFFEQNGVGLSDGAFFGAPGFLRLNFGCPRSRLATALERMAHALKTCPRTMHSGADRPKPC